MALQNAEVSYSDLYKIQDALVAAKRFHVARDEMNAGVHLAENIRLSPLTSTLSAECDRIEKIITTGSGGDGDGADRQA